jgi:hypothetical protein
MPAVTGHLGVIERWALKWQALVACDILPHSRAERALLGLRPASG